MSGLSSFHPAMVAKLRYRVRAVNRQSTSTLIVEQVSKAFMQEGQIEFAYVKREVLVTPKEDTSVPPQYLYIQQLRGLL